MTSLEITFAAVLVFLLAALYIIIKQLSSKIDSVEKERDMIYDEHKSSSNRERALHNMLSQQGENYRDQLKTLREEKNSALKNSQARHRKVVEQLALTSFITSLYESTLTMLADETDKLKGKQEPIPFPKATQPEADDVPSKDDKESALDEETQDFAVDAPQTQEYIAKEDKNYLKDGDNLEGSTAKDGW